MKEPRKTLDRMTRTILVLVVGFGAVTSCPRAPGQESETILYEEDFDDGPDQLWELARISHRLN
jgi:hypothetical protein